MGWSSVREGPSAGNIVHTDFELGRVMCTVAAADPGIIVPPLNTEMHN